MKTLTTSSLLALLFATAGTVGASAAPAPRGPDFNDNQPHRGVDRTLAASDGRREIPPSDAIMFAVSSPWLSLDAEDQIASAAAYLRAHPSAQLVVEGHADRSGSEAYNDDLALRRAQTVRAHLRSYGIGVDRIVLAVYGARGDDDAINSTDRRVELFTTERPARDAALAELATGRVAAAVWAQHGQQVIETRGRASSVQISAR